MGSSSRPPYCCPRATGAPSSTESVTVSPSLALSSLHTAYPPSVRLMRTCGVPKLAPPCKSLISGDAYRVMAPPHAHRTFRGGSTLR